MLLDDETVMRYLRDHTDFFQRHPELVSELELPHESGSAVSLVERQVALLRDRNIELRKRLGTLLQAAEENDALFTKTRALTLALLDAGSLDDLDTALRAQFLEGFGADFVSCYFSGNDALRGCGCLHLRPSPEDFPLLQMTASKSLYCGSLRAEEMAAIFGAEAGSPGSAVLIHFETPARSEGAPLSGLLAIGSLQPERFTPEMGTLFVSHIGEVLGRTLQRVLGQRASA